jgi:hypothetical protein
VIHITHAVRVSHTNLTRDQRAGSEREEKSLAANFENSVTLNTTSKKVRQE